MSYANKRKSSYANQKPLMHKKLNDQQTRSQISKSDLDKQFFINYFRSQQEIADSSNLIKSQINDAYTNSIGGYGYENGVAQRADFVQSRGLSWDFNRINQIYRTQPLLAKICNTKSFEMVKAGIELKSSITPDKVSFVEEELRRYDIELGNAANWGFAFGLSACIIYLKGEFNEKALSSPLDMDMVTPDSFIGLKTVIRWQGIIPLGGEYVKPEDVAKGYASAAELGEPLYYEVWFLNTSKKYKIHRSRLIIFNCNKLPGIEDIIEMGAGVSEVERLWLPLLNYLATINYVQNMLQISQQRVLFLAEGDRIGLMSEEGQNQFQSAMNCISKNADVNNMLVLDQNDEFEYKSANFANLDKIIQSAQEDLAAAANMPLNKLFGKSPTGLNNSSKENLIDFYDYIARLQNLYLRPAYEKLIPIIYKSKYGEDIEEFSFNFKSLFMPDEQEKALIIDRKTRPVEKAWENNAIDLYTYVQEMREIGKVCDCFTNITDETLAEIEKQGIRNARFSDFQNGYIINSEMITDIGTLKKLYKDKQKLANNAGRVKSKDTVKSENI